MKKIPLGYTMVPMVVILVLTLWAMISNLLGFISEGEVLLVGLSTLILVLTLWLTIGSILALSKKKDK